MLYGYFFINKDFIFLFFIKYVLKKKKKRLIKRKLENLSKWEIVKFFYCIGLKREV